MKTVINLFYSGTGTVLGLKTDPVQPYKAYLPYLSFCLFTVPVPYLFNFVGT